MYFSGFFIIWTIVVCTVGGALLYREGVKSGLEQGRAQGWRQATRRLTSSTSPRGVN